MFRIYLRVVCVRVFEIQLKEMVCKPHQSTRAACQAALEQEGIRFAVCHLDAKGRNLALQVKTSTAGYWVVPL